MTDVITFDTTHHSHTQSYLTSPPKNGYSQTGSNICVTSCLTGNDATICKQDITLL